MTIIVDDILQDILKRKHNILTPEEMGKINWYVDDTMPDTISYAYDDKIVKEYLDEKKKKNQKKK